MDLIVGVIKNKTTIVDAKTIRKNSIANVKNKKVVVDVTSKTQDVGVKNLTTLKVVDVVITIQLLIVIIQDMITQILAVIKVDLVGINNLSVDRNIYTFCYINKNVAYNTLDVFIHLEGVVA